jgi:hypothetical protein
MREFETFDGEPRATEGDWHSVEIDSHDRPTPMMCSTTLRRKRRSANLGSLLWKIATDERRQWEIERRDHHPVTSRKRKKHKKLLARVGKFFRNAVFSCVQ